MRSIEEMQAVVQEEKRQYEERRKTYFENPRNWTNNKRRAHGYPALRGKLNKYRPSPPRFNGSILFPLLEDIIEETLPQKINNNFFGQFVEVKNYGCGDKMF